MDMFIHFWIFCNSLYKKQKQTQSFNLRVHLKWIFQHSVVSHDEISWSDLNFYEDVTDFEASC